ncbi:MAG: helicase-related protein [Oscillospiraceae bacterium]
MAAAREHEIDLLVCTTIIETGVDVPNANTLIMKRLTKWLGTAAPAARAGVAAASLCVFLLQAECSAVGCSVSGEAIREFTEFGSGFKLQCATLKYGARAAFWAASSTAIWKRWGTICT